MSSSLRIVLATLASSIALACTSATPAVPQPSPGDARLDAAIDSIVRTQVLARGITGVSLVIARDGHTLLERSWGYADLDANTPATPSTTFRSGSIAKQFTAALLLKEVDRGHLTLSDTLGKFFSGMKPEWNTITIEQLMNHTSGLPREFRDPSRVGERMSADSLVALAVRSPAALTPPGTRFTYSNTGYMLLGALVEKLYGRSYGAAVRDEIARPLGLTSLTWCADVDATAKGYMRPPNAPVKLAPWMHPTLMLGNGGICSTAGDLSRWNHALHTGKVLSAASYAAMTTPRGTAARANVPYGLGLYVRKDADGIPVIVHDGSTVGYNGENVWYPEQRLSLTMLYNSSPSLGADLNLTESMARVVLGRGAPPAK